ncbi:MAG: hypothetical protein HY833_00700 [Candidatus Aenigmarchaeota archaeon]|nr:hypothetical protein [Candidatus Aenigmarchaeota archaeon]
MQFDATKKLADIEREAERISFSIHVEKFSGDFRDFFRGYIGEESRTRTPDLESTYRTALEHWIVSMPHIYATGICSREEDGSRVPYEMAADGYKIRGFYRGLCRAFNKVNGNTKEYSEIGEDVADRFSKKIMEEPSILDEIYNSLEHKNDESPAKFKEIVEIFTEKIFS